MKEEKEIQGQAQVAEAETWRVILIGVALATVASVIRRQETRHERRNEKRVVTLWPNNTRGRINSRSHGNHTRNHSRHMAYSLVNEAPR